LIHFRAFCGIYSLAAAPGATVGTILFDSDESGQSPVSSEGVQRAVRENCKTLKFSSLDFEVEE
jgi:hypothetical protein